MNIVIDELNSNSNSTVGYNPKYRNLQKEFTNDYLEHREDVYNIDIEDVNEHTLLQAQKQPSWN